MQTARDVASRVARKAGEAAKKKRKSERGEKYLGETYLQFGLTIIYHCINITTLVWSCVIVADLNMSPKSEKNVAGISNLQRCADYMIDDSSVVRFSGRGWVYMAFAFSIFFVLPYLLLTLQNAFSNNIGDEDPKRKKNPFRRVYHAFLGLMGISDPTHQVRSNALAGNFLMLCVFIIASTLSLRSIQGIPCSDPKFWSAKDVIDINSKSFLNPTSYESDDNLFSTVPGNASDEFWWFKQYFVYQFFSSVFISAMMFADLLYHYVLEGHKPKVEAENEGGEGSDDDKETRVSLFVPNLEDGLSNNGNNRFRF